MIEIREEISIYHDEIVSLVGQNLEDEVDSILTWLEPEFQPQIPTLRIKQNLKLVTEKFDAQISYLFQQYYITIIRSHFFRNFNSITQWKDATKLEKAYTIKTEFLFGTVKRWILDEILALRRFLIKKHEIFKRNLLEKLEQHVLADEFDRFNHLYQWLAPAFKGEDIEFNVRMINTKIEHLSRTRMADVVDDRYLVMNTYNYFIEKFWTQFAKVILGQDDHEITSAIYSSFEKNFIQYKCEEFYNQIVPRFPNSRKCLLELRSILNKDIKTVGTSVLENLYRSFVSKFLTSSFLTCEILYYYVKTVKCLKVIDSMGICLRSLSRAVRTHLQTRSDLVKTILVGMFPFDRNEINLFIFKGTGSSIHLDQLERFAKEIGDFSLGPQSTTVVPWTTSSQVSSITYDGNDVLLREYLNWVPEPPRIRLESEDSESEVSKYVPPADLILVLLEILHSKRALIDELLGIVAQKLIESNECRLDKNWQEILNMLLKRLDDTKNGTITTEEDDLTHLNDVDVMVKDMERSENFQKWMAQFDHRLPQIKILSKLYWRHYKPLDGRLITSSYTWDEFMRPIVDKIRTLYEQSNIGRTINIDSGVSSSITFHIITNSGTRREFTVSMEKYLVISQFQESSVALSRSISVEMLHKQTKIPKDNLKRILSFWEDNQVIVKTDLDTYHVLE